MLSAVGLSHRRQFKDYGKEWLDMTLGEKIYRMRSEKGMSQETFGEMLGVSRHEPAIIRLNQEKPTKSRVCTDSVLFI